jgi:serine/threonine protein kinase
VTLLRANTPNALGRYRLVCELAQSYLGPLWAVRVSSGEGEGLAAAARRVTLGAGADQELIDRLSEAAWTAMEVQHDRIPKVVDVVVQESEIAVIADYTEGLPLRNVCRQATIWRKPVPAGVALRVVTDVLEALIELHIQARDLGELAADVFGGVTPDSILVGTDGRAYLLDSIVAGAASTVAALRDDPERVAYAAPEQLGAGRLCDARTDVFCVAILLWEMLSNRRLFVGFGESAAQKVLLQKIPRLDEVKRRGEPELPSELVALVARALDRDPKNRPESAQQMLQAARNAGVDVAPAEQLTAFLEQVAERDITRQRSEVAEGSERGPSRKLSTHFKSIRPPPPPPGERAPRAPAGQAPPPPPLPSARGSHKHKQTLLGVAPSAVAAPPAQRPAPARVAPPTSPDPTAAPIGPPAKPLAKPAAMPKTTTLGLSPPGAAATPPVAKPPEPEPREERDSDDGLSLLPAPPGPDAPAVPPPLKHRAAAPVEPVNSQQRESVDAIEPGPAPPGVDAPARPPPMRHRAVPLLEPVPAQRRDSPSLLGPEPTPPAGAEAVLPGGARRRDPGKQTLLGVAPPAAGSHSPSLPKVAGGPLPGPVPVGSLRKAGQLDEEPTTQLSTGQLADVVKAAETTAERALQGQFAASAAALAETQLGVPPGAPAPGGETASEATARPDALPTAMIAAAIAEAAASAPTPSEAAEAAAAEGVDDKVEGTKLPVPMLHDQRVSKVVHPRAPTSSRFGVGFLVGVGTTLGSVAIGALVVALVGGKVPGWSAEASAEASAGPSSGAAMTATPRASANPSAKPQAQPVPSADALSTDATATADAGADAEQAEAPAAEEPQTRTVVPARPAPVFRPRPKPRKSPKYIPDDI